MRWRFADRIDAFEPWKLIRGRKGISLEEYSLLERFGRPGVLPETLVLESCVHFARWLVAASSEWKSSCLLSAINDFVFESEARMGDNFRISVVVIEREDKLIQVKCEVIADHRPLARGMLALEIVSMDCLQDCNESKILWQELKSR